MARHRGLSGALLSLALAASGTTIGALLAPERPKAAADLAFSTPSPIPFARVPGPDVRAAAPQFAVRTLEGRRLGLAEARGRPTVLFFMAYWCGTCIPEAQALGRLHQELSDRGVQIIAVDIDPTSSAEALAEFREAAGDPGYLFAFDERGATARAFGVATLDATVIIDAQGRIAYRDAFVTDYATLRRALGAVL